MAEYVTRRKTHKKKTKRTIVEEEELPADIEQGVNVAYISNSHTVSWESTIGMLIVNFLAKNRRPVSANVVFQDVNGQYESLYNIDLHSTLAQSGLGPDVLLGLSSFENEIEAHKSISMLAEYLSDYQGSLPYEDLDLLNQARAHLARTRVPTVRQVTPSIRQQRAVVRDSVEAVPRSRTPVVAPVRQAMTVRSPSPTSRSRRIVEEIEEETDTTESSTEEEVVTTRTVRRR
ncbi:Hypothetical protein POVR2_LOCUS365 [uncultured virus]|nr:Hypothetical protein POVR2_LOCUS365 [uncultured virus]